MTTHNKNVIFDCRPMVALDDRTLFKVFPAEIILQYAEKKPSFGIRIYHHTIINGLLWGLISL